MSTSGQNFHFVCGSDEFLVQRKGAAVWETLKTHVQDEMSREIIDGACGTVEEVRTAVGRFTSAVQTLALFGEGKAIWFKDISFLADSVTGRAEGTQREVESMTEVLHSIDPSVHILLTASPVDRRRKTFKWFQKNAEFEFIEEGKDPASLVPYLQSEAARHSVEIGQEASETLLELVDANSRLALEELRKLATFLGAEGGEITPKLVLEMVPNFGEGDFFETVDAFYRLDLSATLAAIRRHFFAGYDGRPMITSLQNRNRLLLQMKAASLTGDLRGRPNKRAIEGLEQSAGAYYGEDRTKSAFNVFTQHPFYLGKISTCLERLQMRDLIAFQLEFTGAFRGILNHPNDQERVMREVAIRCLGKLS